MLINKQKHNCNHKIKELLTVIFLRSEGRDVLGGKPSLNNALLRSLKMRPMKTFGFMKYKRTKEGNKPRTARKAHKNVFTD